MVYSVGYITKYIASLFSSDVRLSNVSVNGEVSNITYHRSGHIYFTLKDSESEIKSVMFRGDRGGLLSPINTGDKVIVSGQIRIYEKGGSYQLYAKTIEPDGQGDLYREFLRLKEELEQSGMFDAGYKKDIPAFSSKIGIVTAPTGAAVRDIIRIAKRRNPYVELILYPALVQGVGAKESIIKGIEVLDKTGVDVIIVGRGGGSMEDLWAFNEEVVARAIFACNTPIISAVGHETDYTIADFVADKRAATPSEAAELAVYDNELFREMLYGFQKRFDSIINNSFIDRRYSLEQIEKRIALLSPTALIKERRMRLIEIEERVSIAMDNRLVTTRGYIEALAGRLEGNSPIKRLAGGYAFLSDKDGKSIKDASRLRPGDTFSARLYKGEIKAEVLEVMK